MVQNYSRLNRVQEYQNKKTAMIFGGLTLFIIVFGFFFGIPLISKFVGLFSKPSKTQTQNSNSPIIAPTLSVPPQFTNQQSIILKGTTSPGSKVKIFVNNKESTTQSDSDGAFTVSVGLDKDDNIIFAQTVDKSGNLSDDSSHYTVVFDNKAPELTVNSPTDGQTFFGSKQKTITITGTTDADGSLSINDRVAIIDNTGKFNFSYELGDGDNELKIVAKDKADNKKEIDLKVTYNP